MNYTDLPRWKLTAGFFAPREEAQRIYWDVFVPATDDLEHAARSSGRSDNWARDAVLQGKTKRGYSKIVTGPFWTLTALLFCSEDQAHSAYESLLDAAVKDPAVVEMSGEMHIALESAELVVAESVSNVHAGDRLESWVNR